MSDLSENELDAFDSKRDEILFEQAGNYLNQNQSDEESDEEVMRLKNVQDEDDEEDDDEDEDDENENENENDDENDENDDRDRWGSKKNYYGGDEASDDEAAREMANEAVRQQKKHLQELEMDDFVDEDMMDEWKKTADSKVQGDFQFESEKDNSNELDLSKLDEDEKLNHLTGSFPEFVPLLKEFKKLNPKLESLKLEASNLETLEHLDVTSAKISALSAYLGSISSYFALFAENLRQAARFSMKENPVMESILSSREVWRQTSQLSGIEREPKLGESVEQSDNMEESDIEQSDNMEAREEFLPTDSESEPEEQDEESMEESKELNIDLSTRRTIKTPGISASGSGLSGSTDYTESLIPDIIDKEEKERRKKSLRFYTSKIDQAAQKNSRSERFTGDTDLPYKERLFERQQRLVEEARKRGLDKDGLGENLDQNDFNSDDENLAREINDQGSAAYYETIKASKIARKQARETAHNDAKKAFRDGKLADLQETVGRDGKRALNFQILKNKGLTPKKRNENRNARVKKRKKYDQAKKKLKSVRQVYDQNSGPYSGEKTGIKKGVSRSIKLV